MRLLRHVTRAATHLFLLHRGALHTNPAHALARCHLGVLLAHDGDTRGAHAELVRAHRQVVNRVAAPPARADLRGAMAADACAVGCMAFPCVAGKGAIDEDAPNTPPVEFEGCSQV